MPACRRCRSSAAITDDSANPSKPAKVVLFATLPTTADRIASFLRPKLGPALGGIAKNPTPPRGGGRISAWQRLLTDPACRVLVCDRQAEDGLNLQGTRMILLHYDLPFARTASNSGWAGSTATASASQSAPSASPIQR
jgi:ATP-dependent helicase HepA